MSNIDIYCLVKGLELQLNKKGELVLDVVGNSMLPAFAEGDCIKIKKADNLSAGDIIVFVYNMNLLVHRILCIRQETLYCKGDNSFRIEEITYDDILGKVTGAMRSRAAAEQTEIKLPEPDEEFLALSMAVGREFLRLGCDRERMRESQVFQQYQTYVSRQFDVKQNKLDEQDGTADRQDETKEQGRQYKCDE